MKMKKKKKNEIFFFKFRLSGFVKLPSFCNVDLSLKNCSRLKLLILNIKNCIFFNYQNIQNPNIEYAPYHLKNQIFRKIYRFIAIFIRP